MSVRSLASLAAALLLLAGTPSGVEAQSQRLGRLFSTPDERLFLDELRRRGPEILDPVPAVTALEAAPAVPTSEQPYVDRVTFNGMVRRSDGGTVSWINGVPIPGGGTTPDGVRVETRDTLAGGVRIVLPGGAETVELKPGQRIDVVRGRVLEAYEVRPGEGAEKVFEGLGEAAPAKAAGASPGGE